MIYFWQLIKSIIFQNINHFWRIIWHLKGWSCYKIPFAYNTCQCFFVSIWEKMAFTLLSKYLPSVYERYDDDISVDFNSYTQLLKFIDYMNHQHPKIITTFKVE